MKSTQHQTFITDNLRKSKKIQKNFKKRMLRILIL